MAKSVPQPLKAGIAFRSCGVGIDRLAIAIKEMKRQAILRIIVDQRGLA